ncbi:MAG: hypothetical protein V1899_03865 [Planctomycetota bacterium]
MTRHDDTVALRHMRDHASETVEIMRDRSRNDLDVDRLFALGLCPLSCHRLLSNLKQFWQTNSRTEGTEHIFLNYKDLSALLCASAPKML